MRIGPAIVLVVVGAIFAYAVNWDVPGFDIRAAGAVLFWVGLLWVAVEVGLVVAASRPARPRAPRVKERAAPPPAARPVERPYDPIMPPPRERPRARPPASDAPTRRLGPDDDDTAATRVTPPRR